MRVTNLAKITTPLISVLCLGNINACFSAELDKEINAYTQHHFEQAINSGLTAISQDPNNTLAHYYLANAYCELDKIDKAIEEYSICMKLDNNSQAASYSRQALAILNNGKKDQTSFEAVYSDTTTIQSQINDLKQKYAKAEQEQLDKTQQETDKLADVIHQHADEEVAAQSPPVYVCRTSYGRPTDSSMFADNVNDIRQDEESRIKNIYDQLPKEQEMIKETFEQKINALNPPTANVNEQSYRLAPTGTNIYVRNYAPINPSKQSAGLKAIEVILTPISEH